ncbi:MAG TPA: HNH endonuclease signature motif containing protein [Acidimicrobiales bacterium]|nr:HNH endonuclease signature motif containing protein [Acidimicrobiales bacterium]
MSSWAKGSTRRWRRTRAQVLARDGYRCRIQLDGCTGVATHVHHVHGRAVTGDDPAHLVAACEWCNLSTGDPTKAPDPQPKPRTRW